MATRTSIASGDWSNPAIWDTGVPLDGDTVILADPYQVDFDVDQSAFVTGILGIQVRGIFKVKPGGARVLKIDNYPALNGAIICDQRGALGDTIGQFLCGDSLSNGLSAGSSFKIEYLGNAVGDQLFQQTEDPFLNGNKLNVRIFDQYGHVQRDAKVIAYNSVSNVATIDYGFPLSADGHDVCIIANRSAKSFTTQSGAIVDNGDGTFDITLASVSATTEGQLGLSSVIDKGPNVLWAHSNVIIENFVNATTTYITGSLVEAEFCCQQHKWSRLNQSGIGMHSHKNKWYGCAFKVSAPLDQGSGSQLCGTFIGSNTTFGDDTQGNFTSSNFKDHVIGKDSFSWFGGFDKVYENQTGLSGSGSITLRGKFHHFGRATDATTDTKAFMSIFDAEFRDVGEFTGTEMFQGFTPIRMENVSFDYCDPIQIPIDASDMFGPVAKRFKDVTITNPFSVPWDFDANRATFEWSIATNNIVFENLNLEGVVHDYYLLIPGVSTDGIGVVTTETTGLPAGFTGSAQKMSFYSGYAPLYVEKRVYLTVNQSISINALAHLVDLAEIAPRIEIHHESAEYFNIVPARLLADNSEILASSAFHSGTIGNTQSGVLNYKAIKEGFHIIRVAVWMADQGDSFGVGNEKVVWATLQVSTAGGGGGSFGIRRAIQNFRQIDTDIEFPQI